MVDNVFARHVFRLPGLSAQREASLLIPDTNLPPAEVLVQPPTSLPGAPFGIPIACDITVRSSYVAYSIRRAALSAARAALFADEEKLRALHRAVRANLSLTDTAAMPHLGFDFV